ncbi:hypothetical protein BKA93DRAFT_459531 [Sparassis latifolia]
MVALYRVRPSYVPQKPRNLRRVGWRVNGRRTTDGLSHRRVSSKAGTRISCVCHGVEYLLGGTRRRSASNAITIGTWTVETVTYPKEPHVLKPQTSKLPMLQTLKLQMSKLPMLGPQTLKPQLKQTLETIAVEVPVELLDRRGALEFNVRAEVVCQVCSPDENQKINDEDLEFTTVTLYCEEKVLLCRP